MAQISKNVLYSSSSNELFDTLGGEVLETKAMQRLSEITSPINFFLSTLLIKFDSLSKDTIMKVKNELPLKKEQRKRFFMHLISGGGGSIFQYKDFIFKITPQSKQITSDKELEEITIPKYLMKLLKINDYTTISDFINIPLYVRYGDFTVQFKAIVNLYHLCLITVAYTNLKASCKQINKKTLLDEVTKIKNDQNPITDKVTQINLMLLSLELETKMIIINNLPSFNVILKSPGIYGYVTVAETAIMSVNKLTTTSLNTYFKDTSINYQVLLENLSLQLVFQVFLFYHTVLKMKPSFVHKDLKLDNILMFDLSTHKIKQKITIQSEKWEVNIKTPIIFKLNDFEHSEVDSNKSWTEDIKFLFFSIKYYKNLILPRKLYEEEITSYDKLENVLKDKMFHNFMKRII